MDFIFKVVTFVFIKVRKFPFYTKYNQKKKKKIHFNFDNKFFLDQKNVVMKVTTRLYYGLIVASKAKMYIMFRLCCRKTFIFFFFFFFSSQSCTQKKNLDPHIQSRK